MAKSQKWDLANSKKSIFAKFKKSDLLKDNFAKVNSSEMDFLIPKAKKAFIYLQKSSNKALILRYFNLKHYIGISTNVLGYAIDKVLSQMTLNQYSFNYMIHKD